MIEIVYNKGKEKPVGSEEYFCTPKNIRQIGTLPPDTKIYLEDYVYTYLTSGWKKAEPKEQMAVLLGTCSWKNGKFYVFIKSAVWADYTKNTREQYILSDMVLGDVYEEIKEYFSGQEIVGWYLSVPDGGMKITDSMLNAHLKQFGENEKVFLLADPTENESSFYLYRNNRMDKQSGFYIFYEKNEDMQEYILEKNPEIQDDFSGKAQDRAVCDFRKIIARKQENKKKQEGGISWGVAACTGVVAVALVGGVLFYGSGRMKSQAGLEQEDAAAVLVEDTVSETGGDGGLVLLTPEVTEMPEANNIENASDYIEETENEKSADTSGTEKNTEGMDEEKNQADEESQETAISVYTKYTVRKGDTLSKISMRYYGDFSKIAEICKINNMLEEDIIRPGQTILLP